jgi:protein TonB
MNRTITTRIIIFIIVAVFHLVLILFFAIKVNTDAITAEEPVPVMKILDLQEAAPPPPPLPVPPPENPGTVESIAETMIETDEVPEDQVVAPPGSIVTPGLPAQGAEEEYLSMGKISVAPVFSEREIRANLVYPAIARRSGIEGLVYLELFIDSRGRVQQINVLREEPANRGFGEAATAAFKGLTCTPAEANGQPVAVRYRYPVRFRLRD